MSRHDNEPLHNAPQIVPERDEVASRQRRPSGKGRAVEAEAGNEPRDGSAGAEGRRRTGPMGWLFGLLALAALGWAGYLQMQLEETRALISSYQLRVEDLEGRLSVTDESVTESSVAMQVKLKELDAEIRKLWDNVWKKTQQTMQQHSSQIATLQKGQKSVQANTAGIEKKLTQQATALAEVRKEMDRFAKSEATGELNKRKLEEQQAALEALSGKLGQIANDQSRLAQRVGTNEEWVQSINNFRKQTNRELVNIKQQMSGPVQLEPLAP